jgi:hypothetical protein
MAVLAATVLASALAATMLAAALASAMLAATVAAAEIARGNPLFQALNLKRLHFGPFLKRF